MSSFALVSTVDSLGKEFPSDCVILFDSEREAYLCAAKIIVEHDSGVKYIEEEATWTMDGHHFFEAKDLVEAWQEGLDSTEYFHVKPVKSIA